nr:DUF5610 domain-containing protein [Methylomarinum sp. Ch1-1]MDP4519121.1 DUF5610 domain-containing protein [Methylomarinum sp. Ch1-1]
MFTSALNSSLPFTNANFSGFDRARVHGQENYPLRKNAVSPQKIVDLKVVDTLEKTLNQQGLSLRGLEVEDFTPQNVADRILSSVRQAYGQFKHEQAGGEDDEFFAQIRAGLEQGFAEGKDILQNLGVLQGQIAADVEETIGLTMRGIDQLQSPQALTEMAYQSVSMQSSRTAELELETREGDKVTISFGQFASTSSDALSVSQSGASLSAFRYDETFGSELTISIEGDLNRDEQKAVRHLLQDMNKIGNAFFTAMIRPR